MKPQDKIQLMSGLLDLPILDKDWRYCGIVDDIEFDEEADHALRVKALMVGPGAYRGRLPGWAFRIVRWIAGDHVSRVPWDAIDEIGSAAVLKVSGDVYGLHRGDDKAGRWIPHRGAL
jgi:sporulation protein YlmC with PRC-barrel domain